MSRKKIAKNHTRLLIEIGSKLQKERVSKGINIQDMAQELNMSRNGYALMEKGQIYFNFSTLLMILDKLEISYSTFFSDL